MPATLQDSTAWAQTATGWSTQAIHWCVISGVVHYCTANKTNLCKRYWSPILWRNTAQSFPCFATQILFNSFNSTASSLNAESSNPYPNKSSLAAITKTDRKKKGEAEASPFFLNSVYNYGQSEPNSPMNCSRSFTFTTPLPSISAGQSLASHRQEPSSSVASGL